MLWIEWVIVNDMEWNDYVLQVSRGFDSSVTPQWADEEV